MTSLFASALVSTLFLRYAPQSGKMTSYAVDGEKLQQVESMPVDAPLGSLWKFFVFFYFADNPDVAPPIYQCTGQDPEERFCCEGKNMRVSLDTALFRSCTPAFSAAKAQISAAVWKNWWHELSGDELPQLAKKDQLAPEISVPVASLLHVLAKFHNKPSAIATTYAALANVALTGTARGAVSELGTALRAKTYTWAGVGGLAGWLADGSTVWLGGKGTSAQVVHRATPAIKSFLAKDMEIAGGGSRQVCVNFFARYPISRIVNVVSQREVSSGPLQGETTIYFKNGKELRLIGDGKILLNAGTLSGCFSEKDYIARVIDREVRPEPAEAAKAFAVLARSFLVRYGRLAADKQTLLVEDSTHFQRVSFNPPSAGAQEAAAWTDMLELTGEGLIRYRSDRSKNGALGWLDAVELAGKGFRFDEILRIAYPKHRLGVIKSRFGIDCVDFPKATQWLAKVANTWNTRLQTIVGFEPPNAVDVCRLSSGPPFSEPESQWIHIKSLRNTDDEIALAHEYIHIALRNHPSSLREQFVEELARQLVIGGLAAGVPDETVW